MADAAIIADDLTGACDTGVKLTNLGYETQVIINVDNLDSFTKDGSQLFSVNTDTRGLTPDNAYNRVKQTVEVLKKKGISLFYKKIDSVLRGNIGREIDAMFDALDYQIAVVAPALPDNGRIIRSGKLYVRSGEGAEEVYTLTVKDALSDTADRSGKTVELSVVRQGKDAIKSEIARLYAEGHTMLLFDAEVNDDLRLISEAIAEMDLRILPVGSAGLIRYLWPSLDGCNASDTSSTQAENEEARTLMVVGSIHPATLAQIQALHKRKNIHMVAYPVRGLTEENSLERISGLISGIKRDLGGRAGPLEILVTTERILKNDFAEYEQKYFKDVSNELIAGGLSEIANQLLDPLKINRLIATGGDTASHVFNKAGIRQMKLLAEPMPGIVAGIVTAGADKKLLLATKSGGFGGEDALNRLMDYMSGETVKGMWGHKR